MKHFSITTQERKGFKSDTISYSIIETTFGLCLVATADKGVVAVLFADTKKALLEDLQSRFKNSSCKEGSTKWSQSVQHYLNGIMTDTKIPLQLIGTPFQTEVWKALLEVKSGTTCDYGAIAEKIGDKKKSRAVGTAIGNNPIGYIIPCHRVLRSDGGMGGYRWGIERKKAMLDYETLKK
ncbi:methylated-DNA--[protein]-cysteine S-methyltransferase [Patescibacteria group bacterium]|nr:methylated-DNA--[protein]-cysteine S-methyltransferase [Patescibacteria group bacterium]